MTSSAIRYETRALGVALIKIDAPPTNALGQGLRREFLSHLKVVEEDLSIRVAIVTGRDEAFCSGDDLKEREDALRNGGEDPASHFGVLVDRIEHLRVPVIAAVNGWAIGGGLELALSCDIRIASGNARFVCAAVNVGLIASAYRLPRTIGVARAKHMLMTGLPTDAATAQGYGLVTEVHAPDALLDAAIKLAERIATRAPLSVEATKRIAGAALDLDADGANRAVRKEFELLVNSADHAEALAAFRSKRTPVFGRH
jgi:enoyl-CoA hydratase